MFCIYIGFLLFFRSVFEYNLFFISLCFRNYIMGVPPATFDRVSDPERQRPLERFGQFVKGVGKSLAEYSAAYLSEKQGKGHPVAGKGFLLLTTVGLMALAGCDSGRVDEYVGSKGTQESHVEHVERGGTSQDDLKTYINSSVRIARAEGADMKSDIDEGVNLRNWGLLGPGEKPVDFLNSRIAPSEMPRWFKLGRSFAPGPEVDDAMMDRLLEYGIYKKTGTPPKGMVVFGGPPARVQARISDEVNFLVKSLGPEKCEMVNKSLK